MVQRQTLVETLQKYSTAPNERALLTDTIDRTRNIEHELHLARALSCEFPWLVDNVFQNRQLNDCTVGR